MLKGMMRLTTYTGWSVAFCILNFHGSFAQAQEPIAKAPITREEAGALKVRASAMKVEAEQQFGRDMAECYKKSFPNSCIDAAKKRKQELLTESQNLDKKGREGEREARRLEREAKEAQRAADAPRLEAEEIARIEKLHQEQAKRDADREAKREKEAIDLEQRRAKIPAEEAARRKKHEEQARRDAENEKLRPLHIREQQEREKEIAEHAAKIDERARKYAEDQKRKAAEATARRAAEDAAKRNPDKKDSFICEHLPGHFCTEAGTGK